MLPFPIENFSDKTKTNAAFGCLFHFLVGEPNISWKKATGQGTRGGGKE